MRRIRGRNWTKGDLLVYSLPSGDVAVKDYRVRPWPVRNTVGRWLLRRETAAYLAAGPVAGLPEFLGRVDAFRLATRWVDARPLARLAFDTGLVDQAAAIVGRLHDNGIAVADLHHRDLLAGDDGSVYLVDLAMAYALGSRPGALRRRLFERFRQADLIALARLRARASGEDEEAAVLTIGADAARWHRRGRRLKVWWNRLRRAVRSGG
jgi:hypothetical protein